ncbi:uncharacterized protein Nmlp_3173 [Natronomonas moolapensis 8.8.11]|uniref:Uncharacterized protein n=1 Tax=Natronomonas moolapensis (strain DSM 18674 / CECT 7526 / JCM 14361 / 8.8.11) TaxID=268739 RepID=M1Y455_NATM8|nr:DUF5799 family protein [Natronomonas moolapensis]CCQ37310.1 uncharacterized protein Nmlp_3173 [Natronomonas moolapensis 8.8.11]
MTDWQDMIVGDRMAVDGEFDPRVDDSRFTRQEWGLIMTATTFEIESPEDDEAAELVANTEELRGMMPEIEKVAEMDPMGGNPTDDTDSGGGFLGSVFSALGLGGGGGGHGGVDEEKLEAAEALVADYATELQAHLESDDRWDEIRAEAASE